MLAFEALARGAREARLPGPDLADLVEAAASTVGVGGMIGGQVADLRSLRPGADLATVEYVHSRKTGRLFVLCVRAGALLARARAREVAALETYARNLGLAFQVTDDVLDAVSTSEALGKDTARDRGKTTFVDLCGLEEARRLAGDLVATAKEALTPFGRRSRVLAAIADYLLSRVR
jgi:geranylgeranyl diphosphate synthase type II